MTLSGLLLSRTFTNSWYISVFSAECLPVWSRIALFPSFTHWPAGSITLLYALCILCFLLFKCLKGAETLPLLLQCVGGFPPDFDIEISALQPIRLAKPHFCNMHRLQDFKELTPPSSIWCSAAVSSSIRKCRLGMLCSWRCATVGEIDSLCIFYLFFNKLGNNNKSYRLITHSPITRPPPLNAERCSITLPPPSITPFIMHLIWPPVWLSVQWEALQTLHSLYLRVCVFMCWGCWQEWKTAFGGVWAHASVYRIYWDVWSCVEMCEWEHGRSTEVYKSNRMIVLPLWSTLSQQVHSSFFPFFFHFYCPFASFCLSRSFFPFQLLLLPLLFSVFFSVTDLSGGPCLISSSAGCWETGDKF